MSLDVQKDKVFLNKVTHSVRTTQAVLQYGVGAMVDFPDQTLMTAAPEYWEEGTEKIHDERLEKVLHVDYFAMPGTQGDSGISYVRFPEWYFCPKCRRFKPLVEWTKEYLISPKTRSKTREIDPYMVKHMKCSTCFQDLVVSRVVTVCEHGHIDDFPWVKWVHCQNYGGAKPICSKPKIVFKTGASATEGLEGLEVICETCHARATLKGAFDRDKFRELDEKNQGVYNFRCTGRHPWKHGKDGCDLYPRVMQRGSSSVYFPVIASSLVIPPYSNMLTKRVEESQSFEECKTTLSNALTYLPAEAKPTFIDSLIGQFSEKIAREITADINQVKGILERKWKSENSEEYSTVSVQYRAEEYEALSGEIVMSSDDYGDFLRESTNIEEYGLPYIKQISLIHKIREVQALIGFSRIKPAEKSEATSHPENVVSVKEPTTNWYPAYQVRGEGIFLEFDENAIQKWEKSNDEIQRRVDILNEKYKESFIGANNPRLISAKFLLLHTISHLLIKQLSFECGYSIASLKERIYCSEENEGKKMAGILIYTASGDAEGTMGGLVRQGRSDTFPAMFKKAIEAAMTCSNDPVCSLSLGQGRDSLNMAACYSCTLIPETSCEEFNVFLDRGVVVGTFNDRNIAFFKEQLYGDKHWKTDVIVKAENTPKVEHPEDKPRYQMILGSGTDVSALPYEEIWDNLLEWSEDKRERALLTELKTWADAFAVIPKPICDCDFQVAFDDIVYQCDLAWKDKKVAFFTNANAEDYLAAKQSDWVCISSMDADMNPEKIINILKDV